MFRRIILTIASLLAGWVRLGAQVGSPDSAQIYTHDIANFWRAVDRAAGKDSAALVAAIREEYLGHASPGLIDWMVVRLMSSSAVLKAVAEKGWTETRAESALVAAPGSALRVAFDAEVLPLVRESAASNLARKYLARRAYYDAVRRNTLAVDTARDLRDSVRAAFRRLEAIYPDARYPDVYLLIGRMTSGGTTSGHRLLIGTEMFGRDASTPLAELSPWEAAVTGSITTLPQIIAHEFVHTLQAERAGRRTLLSASLDEGTADFVAELISGGRILNPAYAYGDAHERELWAEFSAAMDSSNVSAWLYQGDKAAGRPADLGYWMGYRIAKAFYDRAADKRAAVKAILTFTDARAFLAESQYGHR